MTYTFKLSRRIAGFRAPMLAALFASLAGCNGTDTLGPDSSAPAAPGGETSGPSLVTSNFAGGVPFGLFAQPTTAFGSRYNGAMVNIWPQFLLAELAKIKASGGRTVVIFVGNQEYYKDASGHFDFGKWKARVDRFRSVDIAPYIADGTIIGHYLVDEPNDPANWAGQPISPATVDAMAQYSKAIWPTMTTIARVEPSYFPTTPRYLDAAWAQYLARRGDAGDYVRRNVSDAKARNMGLIVGLNVLKGGNPNGTTMSASEVQTYGTALLSSTYSCAFISWTWDSGYLGGSSMGSAMDALRRQASNRSTTSCRSGSTAPVPSPSPTPTPTPTPEPSPTPTVDTPLPFGLFQAPMDEYSSRWTGSLYRAEPSDLAERLAKAEGAKMKLVVSMAPPSRVKNSDGTFNLTKWKAQVDQFRSLSLNQAISNRTLYAHSVIESPNCASCWGGRAISWATVEEMARYSKSIWPSLPTT
ncbi:MAG: hypothetical protein ABIQ49_07990, partial [Gemmatimonadales bacterium]